MKTLAFVSIVACLLLPRGGTSLDFPIQGTVKPGKVDAIKAAIRIETWDCPEHPSKNPTKIHAMRCPTCGKALIRTDAKQTDGRERYQRVEVGEHTLQFVSGPWPGIGLLRRSTVVAALRDTGLSLLDKGCQLRGHVLFEVAGKQKDKADPEALRKALSAFGTVEGQPGAEPVLVRLADRKDPVEHAAITAAIAGAGYDVKDTLWIVNQCCGELVTVAGK
jgi:hypothetical protein